MQTRRRRCAQVIAPRRSASVLGSFSEGRDARWPRWAGVTCARACAAEGHQALLVARLAPEPQKTVLEAPAPQVLLELPRDVGRHLPPLGGELRHERGVVLLNQLIEQRLLRAVALVAVCALAQNGFPAGPQCAILASLRDGLPLSD